MTSAPASFPDGKGALTHAKAARRLSVLHVITGLSTGGTERMLQKLLRVRTEDVIQSVVQLQSGGVIASEMRDEGIDVTDLSIRRSATSAYQFGKLVPLARRVRPDVIQTWLYHADLVGAILGRVLFKPVVWNIRGSDHPGMHRPVVRMCATLSRLPALIVANSESGRKAHERVGYTAREWRIIPNGFDTGYFGRDDSAPSDVRRELGLPDDARLVGMIARSDPLKDHRLFLAAMAQVVGIVPGTYAVLIGEGMDDGNAIIASAQRDERTRGRIIGLGRRSDIARLTAALDVACLTSVSEGFPNVIGEAMACEIPCVVTDAGASRAVVGDTGIVVPPGDVAAFANGVIRMLLCSDAERRALGIRARRRVIENFSIDSVSATYIDLYRAIVERHYECVE